MIPVAHLQQWAAHAPWPDLRQVEQDLIISRALCDLFSGTPLQGKIAFRGGTAINKLLFGQPLRYSEDIDLVQTKAEPIKETVGEIRDVLSWLGKCSFGAAAHSVHLEFKFTPETGSGSQLKLKVEINTREHQPLFGLKTYPFEVNNDWHQAKSGIVSFEAEELFGTKLRALLQRHKNRDLFDLNEGLLQLGLDCNRVIACFHHYLDLEGHPISRANAEERMLKKLNQSLTEDIAPLLPAGVANVPTAVCEPSSATSRQAMPCRGSRPVPRASHWGTTGWGAGDWTTGDWATAAEVHAAENAAEQMKPSATAK